MDSSSSALASNRDDDRLPPTDVRPLSTLQIGLGSTGLVAGGAERVFADLAAYLPACGVKFCGAVVSAPAGQVGATNSSQYAFAPPGAGIKTRMLGARRLLRELLASRSFDLVGSHFALYSLPALDAIRKVPFVVHFHGPWAAESLQEGSGAAAARAKYFLERLVYGQADRLIVLSKAFSEVLVKDYGIPEQKIRIVSGAVDTKRFAVAESKIEARRALGWPEDRPILISVRRLAHRMGLDLLIDAMPAIVAKYPDVLLYIGGTGSLRESLERRAVELNLTNHVRFLGFVKDDELPLAYRAADFNVVPTRAWEGFGLVAAEAVAAGTPSLVTPVGGLPEVIAPLSSDLIFRSVSTGDIADGLIQALSGSISLPDSAACRAFATKYFSAEIMATRTAAVYRELVFG